MSELNFVLKMLFFKGDDILGMLQVIVILLLLKNNFPPKIRFLSVCYT